MIYLAEGNSWLIFVIIWGIISSLAKKKKQNQEREGNPSRSKIANMFNEFIDSTVNYGFEEKPNPTVVNVDEIQIKHEESAQQDYFENHKIEKSKVIYHKTKPHPLKQLLINKSQLKQAYILKEVLDKPIALRMVNR